MFFKKIAIPFIKYFGKRKQNRLFDKPPVIIGGCARSGTTILLSILSAHAAIWGIPSETAAFCSWNKKNGKIPVPKRMDRIYREILIRNVPSSKRRWCEKSPCSIKYIEEILKYFDNRVKIIHIIRDGRDVMTSIHPKKKNEYWVSPERWLNDVKKGLAFADHPNVYTVKYEHIITDTEQSLKMILDFLGEPYDETMNEWHNHTTKKDDKAWFGGLQKLHPKSIQKWKQEKYKDRVAEIMKEQEVVQLLKELDYV